MSIRIAFQIAVLWIPVVAQQQADRPALAPTLAPAPTRPDEAEVVAALSTWSEGEPFRAGESLRVNTMPDSSVDVSTGLHRANSWVGRDNIVWGNASGGTLPYSWTLSFGDGSPAVTGVAATPSDARYIRARHVYSTQGPKLAVLTVTDADGDSDSDTVRIDVGLKEIGSQVEAAIDGGLRYLYCIQDSNGSFPVLPGADGLIATAFQLRGHYKYDDPDEDIYAETLDLYWNRVWTLTARWAISSAGEPGDPDGSMPPNGFGIYFSGYTAYGGYQQGIMALALSSIHPTGDLGEIIPVGTEAGRSIHDVLQDVIDLTTYAQTNSGTQRGGWRYGITTSSYGSDNSAVQWPVLGMIAAEPLGIAVMPHVKTELAIWTAYSQTTSGAQAGGFGYYAVGLWNNIAKTGSGLIQLAWLRRPYDSGEVQSALNYINLRWSDAFDGGGLIGAQVEQFNNNLYAMYAVKKGMEEFIANEPENPAPQMVGSHDWQDEYNKTLVDDPDDWYDGVGGVAFNNDGMEQVLSGDDLNDGRWVNSRWFGAGGVGANTAAAVLILNPGFTMAIPVPQCLAFPDLAGPGDPITFDASASFHQNPERRIVEYAWDLDDSDGVDFDPPDALGSVVGRTYTLPPGESAHVFSATLRVTDDDDPPIQRTMRCPVTISVGENHPPIALPGGPYTACVGDEILLDGAASYDPDEDEGDSVVAYRWDLDGDGEFDDFEGSTTTVSFPGLYDGFVSLQVEDSHGALSTNVNARVRIFTALGDLTTGPDDLTVDEDAGCLAGTTVCVSGTYRVLSDDPGFIVPSARVDFYLDDPGQPANRFASFTDHDLAHGTVVTHSACFVRPDGRAHSVVMVVDPNQAVNECIETDNRATLDIPCDCCLDEIGKPRRLRSMILQYTAEKCDASSHHQDPDSVECADPLIGPLPDEALVVVRGKPCFGFHAPKAQVGDFEPGQGIASRIVHRDERFVLRATDLGEAAFGDSTCVCIMNRITGKHLQRLSIRTACSEPLFDGDQFGSIRIVSCSGAPLITSQPVLTGETGTPYEYQVEAEDSGEASHLVFSLRASPLGMSIQSLTGKVSWLPSSTQEGVHAVTVRVQDEDGLIDEQIYSISIAHTP